MRAHYHDYILDPQGNALSGASVEIRDEGTTTPISATIYAFEEPDVATLVNPIVVGTDGSVEFYLESPARVDLRITQTGFTSKTATVDVSIPIVASLGVQDEGTTLTSRSTINFTGTGVNAADNAVSSRTDVTVPGPSGTPGNSAVGDAAAAGASTTAAKSDHTHGREAFDAPGSSAVGDVAAAGTAATVPRSDHTHGREAFGGAGADVTSAAGTAGTATTPSHSDHTHKHPVIASGNLHSEYIQLANFTTTGDLLTYNDVQGEPVRLPVAGDGSVLTADEGNISGTGLGWSLPDFQLLDQAVLTTTTLVALTIPNTYTNLRLEITARGSIASTSIPMWMRFNSDTGTNYNWVQISPAGTGVSDDHIFLGNIPAASAFVSRYASSTVHITGYAGGLHTPCTFETISIPDNTAANFDFKAGGGVWRNTAAVSTITLLPSSGSFVAGSTFKVYGLA